MEESTDNFSVKDNVSVKDNFSVSNMFLTNDNNLEKITLKK